MRVAFAGTPEFASHALAALHAAGHTVVLVLTQPDRPAGRGMKLQASAVKLQALTVGAPVIQPRSLRLDGKYAEDAAAAQQALQAAAPDVMVVAAYGLILPTWVLNLPPLGCINIHGSVLPRWRGAAPIHRAIEAGDSETGITIMQMDAGLDTGPMLLVQTEPIRPEDTTATLQARLTALGATLVVQALANLPTLHARPQPATGATYAHKIDKGEAAIDWQQPAVVIERRLRAFDPFPGCTANFGQHTLKVWNGRVRAAAGNPGAVLGASAEGWLVACGEQALEVLQVQAPGGKRVAASVFLQQHPGLVAQR
jgi:methionyl-tRNA formyltransferase